jgi:hypothetical protein
VPFGDLPGLWFMFNLAEGGVEQGF